MHSSERPLKQDLLSFYSQIWIKLRLNNNLEHANLELRALLDSSELE